MGVKTEAQLITLLDSLLPSNGPEEHVTVAKMREILRDVFQSFSNTTDDVASATIPGIVELATTAEIDTGTDAGRVITPDDLAASYAGTVIVVLQVFPAATNVATGDGKLYYHVPAALDGMDIVSVHALNSVAGVTGQCDVQIANITGSGDVLSTVLSIDTGEVGSDTGATPGVIDATEDDLATNDILRIDVDAIHSGTAPKGLTVTLECRLP